MSLSVVLWLVRLRSDLGSGDGQAVHLFKDSSVSRVIILRRRLGCVLSVLDGIFRDGLTLSRDLELSAQWGAIVSAGPCGPLCGANLAVSPAVGLSSFGDHVRVLYDVVVDFLHKVVVSRRMLLFVVGALGCLKMIRFILTVGSNLTWWPLHLSCVVILVLLLMVVGFFLILIASMSSFVMLGFPSFVVLVVMPLTLLFLIRRLVVGSLV